MNHRPMTNRERRRVEIAVGRLSPFHLRNAQAAWEMFGVVIVVALGFSMLHRPLIVPLFPGRSVAALWCTVLLAAVVAAVAMFFVNRLQTNLAERMRPHIKLMADDLRERVVEVHCHDSVDSWFDPDQDPKNRDLVVRFPEGDIRVDGVNCEKAKITEPVHGWCEVVRLPRSEQVLSIETRPAAAVELSGND